MRSRSPPGFVATLRVGKRHPKEMGTAAELVSLPALRCAPRT